MSDSRKSAILGGVFDNVVPATFSGTVLGAFQIDWPFWARDRCEWQQEAAEVLDVDVLSDPLSVVGHEDMATARAVE